jgi:tetratricopeptide (TPR) repeat protein
VSPGNEDLPAFLSALRGPDPVESSGRFTIDLAKAREKLRQFQAAEPIFYLLKLVQAAVAARAQRIDVRLTQHTVLLSMVLPPGNPLADSARLTQLLLYDPQSAAVGPVRHLAIGLHASVTLEPERVHWSYWPGQSSPGAWSINLSGGEVELGMAAPMRAQFGRSGTDLAEFSLTRQAKMKPHSYDERQHLARRCAFCPVPLFLDERRLTGLRSQPPPSGELWMGGAYYLSERFLLADDGFRMSAPPWPKLKQFVGDLFFNSEEISGNIHTRFPTFAYQLQGEAVESGTEELLCSCALALPSHLCGTSRLVVVKHGVTLEPVLLTDRRFKNFGVQALVAGDRVATDLSEFKAIADKQLELCSSVVLEQLRLQIEGLEPILSELPHHSDGEGERYWWVDLKPSWLFPAESRRKTAMRERLRRHVRERLVTLRELLAGREPEASEQETDSDRYSKLGRPDAMRGGRRLSRSIGSAVKVKLADVRARFFMKRGATQLNLRGNERFKRKDYDGAIAFYTRAIENDPTAAMPYFNRGTVRFELGDHSEAIADLHSAIGLNRNWSLAYVRLAMIYNNRGVFDHLNKKDHDGAIADFERALELNPELAPARTNLSVAFNNRGLYERYYRGDYDRAVADFEHALELNPSLPFARRNLALAHSKRGLDQRLARKDYAGALADLNRAVELDSRLKQAYLNRALVWEALGESNKAEEDRVRAQEL